VTIDHLSGKRYVSHNEGGDQIMVDSEDTALGVRPREALLAALGTCTARFPVAGDTGEQENERRPNS
jgi:uncharacterized OsmC-like protein